MVYFLKVGTRIKIGYTRKPSQRITALQSMNARRGQLLAIILGGPDKEADLHRQFSNLRLHGEWFKATPYLLDEIGKLAMASESLDIVGVCATARADVQATPTKRLSAVCMAALFRICPGYSAVRFTAYC